MSKATVRGKILFKKILSWIIILTACLSIYLAPLIKVEWSDVNYGIEEQYYANISISQWMFGGEAQIHLKNTEDFNDFEDAFGVTQASIEKMLGKINIDEDIKGINARDYSQGEDAGFLVFMILFGILTATICIMAFFLGKSRNAKKIEETRKSIEAKALNFRSISNLDAHTKSEMFAYVYGVRHRDWSGFFVCPFLPIVPYVLSLIMIDKAKYQDYSFGISIIPSLYLVAIMIVLTVIDFIITDMIVKDATKLNIMKKSTLETIPYFYSGDISEYIKNNRFVNESLNNNSNQMNNKFSTDEPKNTNDLSKNVEKLVEYKKLLDAEILSQEEFDRIKDELLHREKTSAKK